MRLVQIHRQLLLDDVPFLVDFSSLKDRVEEHVHQHIQQFLEPIVTCLRVKTGVLFGSEGVEVATDPFDGLGNLFGGTLARSLEQHVLDKMRHPIQPLRLVAPAHAYPQPQAHAGHVRHLGRRDRQTVLESGDLIHDPGVQL